MCKRMRKKTDVIFLGAGAMNDLGLPLTKDLMRSIDASKDRKSGRHDHKSKIVNFQKNFRVVIKNYFPRSEKIGIKKFFDNPEITFTFLDSLIYMLDLDKISYNIPGNNPIKRSEAYINEINNLKKQFSNILHYFFWDHATDYILKKKSDGYDKNYLYKLVNSTNTFITTNWDLMIEAELYTQKRMCNIETIYGTNLEIQGLATNNTNKNLNLQILKLHGSAGLVDVNGKATPSAEYKFLFKNIFEESKYNNSGDEQNIFILPTYIKIINSSIMLNIWRNAFDKIHEARTIDIVGYSLPEADQAVRTLLLALKDNKKEINVIFPQDEDESAKKRWDEFLGKDKYQYICSKAEEHYGD